MTKRIICSTTLVLALTLPPGLSRAVILKDISSVGEEGPWPGWTAGGLANHDQGRFCRTGRLEPLTLLQVNPLGNQRLLPALGRSPRLAPALPRLTAPLTGGPPFSTGRDNILAPDNLPGRVLKQAYGYLHTPYRFGSSLQTSRATDCSGFVQFIYQKSHIDLPRSSSEQARVGQVAARSMDFSKLQAGDLLFFSHDRRHIGHVGIYLGDEKMIHAADRRHGVVISDLRRSYYRHTFVVAKRVLATGKASGSWAH